MRRFFGSRVVQASRTEGSSSRKKVPSVKSNLTRPQPTWWAAKGREGLSLRSLSDDEAKDLLERHGWTPMQEKWWTVEYSKKYRSMTKAFMDAVLAGGGFHAHCQQHIGLLSPFCRPPRALGSFRCFTMAC